MISVSCVIFTDSWWKTDKWPVFVQVHCSHDVATIHKWEMFAKHASHGNPSLWKSCGHIGIHVKEINKHSRSYHNKECHILYWWWCLLHVSAWRWPGHSWNTYKRTYTWNYRDDFWGFHSGVIEDSGFLGCDTTSHPRRLEFSDFLICCYFFRWRVYQMFHYFK